MKSFGEKYLYFFPCEYILFVYYIKSRGGREGCMKLNYTYIFYIFFMYNNKMEGRFIIYFFK